jgi:NAD(P)-dependent dehydrogenase (short-subunit alcohol dehydrogenase family)
MEIENAGALVSGGASGLGEATVRHLHALGAKVVIADVNAEKGEALAGELGCEFVSCDVREEDQVQAAVDRTAEVAGGIHVAVSCAGTAIPIKTASSKGPHPLDAFKVIVDINLIGTFNVIRLAAFRMFDNAPNAHGERGVLVNTASVAAFDGQVGQVNYSASKGAIVGMTLPVARDLAPKGIRVMTIAPGLFNTPLLAALPEDAKASLGQQVPFPPRLGEPSEYAQLVESIVTNPMLNGETIRLDGAIRMAPR